MWLIAEYEPASLFSLKSSLATSTGGKSLLVPTPFAIRTALVDAAIRVGGIQEGKAIFEWVKELAIVAALPKQVVVINMFTKVRKPRRADSKTRSGSDAEEDGSLDDAEEVALGTAMPATIGFREYVYWAGRISLGFGPCDRNEGKLGGLLLQVNYFGKRGGFVQLRDAPRAFEQLPEGFVPLAAYDEGWVRDTYGEGAGMQLGVVQIMDDWGPELTFEKLDIYSGAKISIGKDRILKSVILPYRLARSSKGFSYYTLLV